MKLLTPRVIVDVLRVYLLLFLSFDKHILTSSSGFTTTQLSTNHHNKNQHNIFVGSLIDNIIIPKQPFHRRRHHHYPQQRLYSSSLEAITSTTTSTTTTKAKATMLALSGGALFSSPSALTSWLTSSLQSGPYGVVALTFVASCVTIPLTQVKNLYGISIAYGLSVAVIGGVLLQVFADTAATASIPTVGLALATAAIIYGVRLASYLLLRQLTGWNRFNTRPEPARWKRIPFAVSLGLFYAFMCCPLLYLLRQDPATMIPASLLAQPSVNAVAWSGTVIAWIGMLVESVADGHKYLVKRREGSSTASSKKKDDDDASTTTTPPFAGPTCGLYAITRHPNYTGEVMFWFGLWLAGSMYFCRSVVGALCSTAGLYGIIAIMQAASAGLEKRQREKYGDGGDGGADDKTKADGGSSKTKQQQKPDPKYEEWKKNTPYPLFIGIK